MKTFEALKTYHIHDYSAIQNWFGNRGFAVEKGHIKEWCYDGNYLFYLPSAEADESLHPEEPYHVVTCALDSSCFEPDDFLTYKDSPFAKKVNERGSEE